jgi:glycosyltransferase involved in cell wall biosynthesis
MPQVCVVVPCYNEAGRLKAEAFLGFLESHPHASLCFVDDGSEDGTFETLKRLQSACADRIVVHRLARNGGKAAAVRAGVLHAASRGSWEILGFWDADLSTPLTEVDRLMTAFAEHRDCCLAMGSRVKRLGSTIERRALRHVLGRIFASCASALLGFSVYDSQCGAKLFRADTVNVFFAEPFLTRWLFDLEMLMRFRNHVGAAAAEMTSEVPLGRWTEVGGSKLRVGEMIQVPLELLAIRRHYNATR